MIKPLYGFISDAVPLLGYRRRSYLALCGLLGAASWAAMGAGVTTPSAGRSGRVEHTCTLSQAGGRCLGPFGCPSPFSLPCSRDLSRAWIVGNRLFRRGG